METQLEKFNFHLVGGEDSLDGVLVASWEGTRDSGHLGLHQNDIIYHMTPFGLRSERELVGVKYWVYGGDN